MRKICSKLAYLGISASRFGPRQTLVFLLADSPQADFLTGRFGESAWRLGYFCWQVPPRQISWLEDFGISASKPPAEFLTGRFGESAGKFPDWQIWWICWQIYWWQSWVFLLADPPNFCWQIWWQSLYLLADFVNVHGQQKMINPQKYHWQGIRYNFKVKS